MRCPYCGGVNRDGVSFCSSCGRDLVPPVQTQQTQQTQQTRQPNRQPGRPPTTPPYPYPPQPQQPQQPHYPPVQRPVTPQPMREPVRAPAANPVPPQPQRVQSALASTIASLTPQIMNAPEPPAPFPPRTMEQLRALESGALAYSVVEESVDSGRKKTVRITYARAVAWQQVATLLKAFREQQSDTCETLIIQGVQAAESNPYRFTNGQLCFDRNVRLGDRLLNRFQIETGSGFESDAIRIVLSEDSVGA